MSEPNFASTPVPPLAAKGSQRWLQLAVNRRPELLDEPLKASMGLPANVEVEWLSPLAGENYVEYRDGATYDRLGLQLLRPSLDFWPAGGPMWDGLARLSTGEVLLIEAKAHIHEIVSTGTRASEPARTKIVESLRAVQRVLAPRADVDWSGTFYQYANRLAHLHFLREDNGVPAHLVFIYFLNAEDVGGPSERAEWTGAIKVVEGYLGLGRHRLSRYVHKLFVDVRDLSAGDSRPTEGEGPQPRRESADG
jgi:hypothetical protein